MRGTHAPVGSGNVMAVTHLVPIAGFRAVMVSGSCVVFWQSHTARKWHSVNKKWQMVYKGVRCASADGRVAVGAKPYEHCGPKQDMLILASSHRVGPERLSR